MRWTVILLAIILMASCRKNTPDKFYTIQGQILESSTNPVPVSNYVLSFYQKSASGLFGGVSGLDTNVKTGNDGKFVFQYNPNKNFGFSRGGTNTNEISLQGIDTIKYKELFPQWYPAPGAVDVNLHTLYLFKKIGTLVRKVQFNTPLNAGETLEVITTNSPRASYYTLTGPISAGTVITVDTIKDCKIAAFNLLTRRYNISTVLQKPSYQKDLLITKDEGDEAYLEVLITYE